MTIRIDHLRDTHLAFDIARAVVGAGFALTPWVLGFVALTAAAWNAWIIGAVVALVALAMLFRRLDWTPWLQLALGLWAIGAPYALGFAGATAALGSHVVSGLLVAAITAIELWRRHDRSASRA